MSEMKTIETVACYVDGCGQPAIPGLRGCPEHALEDVVCKHGNGLPGGGKSL